MKSILTNSSIVDHVEGMVSAQGDIVFFRLPAGWKPVTNDEIHPIDGKLIIQEGEVTGHHHGIRLPGAVAATMFRDDAMARDLAKTAPIKIGTAHLYRDAALAQRMTREKINGFIALERADLCIGFLEISGGSHVVTHDEHAGIRFQDGIYYVGRQIESAGAEERVVSD